MKKIFFVMALFFSSLILCSCNDTYIADIKDVVWIMENDGFRLEAPSEQVNDRGPYCNIYIEGVRYNCIVDIIHDSFDICLFDDSGYELALYSEDPNQYDPIDFIRGTCNRYDLTEEYGKDYIYTVNITLGKECQYYVYCMKNGIEFPETMILFGYSVK